MKTMMTTIMIRVTLCSLLSVSRLPHLVIHQHSVFYVRKRDRRKPYGGYTSNIMNDWTRKIKDNNQAFEDKGKDNDYNYIRTGKRTT